VNLVADPAAVVHVSGHSIPVRTRALSGAERDAMVTRAVAYNGQWRRYIQSVQRELPVVRLEPISSDTR
jgi:hypothetical protein